MPVTVSYAFSLNNMTELEQSCEKTAFTQYTALTRDAHKRSNSQGMCHALSYQWIKKRLDNPGADLSGWLNSRRVIDEAIRIQKRYEQGPDSAWIGYNPDDKKVQFTPNPDEPREFQTKPILTKVLAIIFGIPIGSGVLIGLTIVEPDTAPEMHTLAACRLSETSFAVFDANGGEVVFTDVRLANPFILYLFHNTEYYYAWRHTFRIVDPGRMWLFA